MDAVGSSKAMGAFSERKAGQIYRVRKHGEYNCLREGNKTLQVVGWA